MNARKLTVATAAILLVAVLTGAAMTGVFTLNTNSGAQVNAEATEIITAAAGTGGDRYGLLPEFQKAYNGTGDHEYHFNSSSSNITQECGNCHMDTSGDKHNPPLHPIGLYSSDTGDWFYDDGLHRGPNTQLASQQAGITVSGSTVYCGDCHTPQNASGFADSSNSDRSSDPHSVHRDVLTRVGCIRCHNYDNVTFASNQSWEFTQDNATRDTYGIANPINMTRAWDGKFLSTTNEATYDSSLDSNGSGWNRYGSNDASNSTQYACGDCHDQFHKEGGLGFAFDETASSRKGPQAKVNHTNSIGISSGSVDKTCGACHVTDAHAVHTNGKLITALNWSAANSTERASIQDSSEYSGARGAEFCDECHSQNLVITTGSSATHGDHEAADKLGLNGSKDNLPDLDSSNHSSFDGDCGFCHE